jgi:hypothetical protein
MRILFYTFRTFPHNLLIDYGLEYTFKFGKLHKDLSILESTIADMQPDLIVGFSLSYNSRQETIAINRFNNGVINKNEPSEIKLSHIDTSPFPDSTLPTRTFCNWTMFKIAQKHRVSFHHICREDFGTFVNWTKSLAD